MSMTAGLREDLSERTASQRKASRALQKRWRILVLPPSAEFQQIQRKTLQNSLTPIRENPRRSARWPGGRVVMQRIANPRTSVRFRSWPPAHPFHSLRVQHSARIRSAAFSPIMMAAAWVLALGTMGMIDASATRRPSSPTSFRSGATTVSGSSGLPIRQVPTR